MKNFLLATVIVLCAISASADSNVDAFLTSYSTMDKSGYQILNDYRTQINTTCKRDVTMEEMNTFQKSKEYSMLSALLTTSNSDAPDYKNKISSLGCH